MSSFPARFSHRTGREVEARPAIKTMVRAAGIEPARGYPQRIFVPATAFAAATDGVCGLDYTFTLASGRRCCPSSLYTFPFGLGSGLPSDRFPRI